MVVIGSGEWRHFGPHASSGVWMNSVLD